MNRPAAALAVTLACAILTSCARTSSGPMTPSGVATPASLSPQPNASEAKFVRTVSALVRERFATPTQAEQAGYVRYTAEDVDGIITYTNFHWWSDDRQHPTQVWYDSRGRLIGVDYTQRVTDRRKRPDLWGLQPGRWVHFIGHIHYVVRNPDGSMKYGSMFNEQFVAAGGNPAHPTAQPLVNAHIARRASDVRYVFELPEIWITSFWVIPNPRGAFADSNPNVVPSHGSHANPHPM